MGLSIVIGGLAGSRRLLPTLITGLVVLLAGVPAAIAGTPTGEYSVFAQCPVHGEHVNGCIVSRMESGEMKIGSTSVPIVNAQTLQGGLFREEEPFVKHLVGALNGETLTTTPQPVPGGLFGSTRCETITDRFRRTVCKQIRDNGFSQVNAITELAAPAGSIVFNTAFFALGFGPALTLPVKVRLENPLLGHECYIGSDTNPIVLGLMTGLTSPPPPNTPITGNTGEQTVKAEGGVLELSKSTLVDNSFAIPAASGCGPHGLLDQTIDTKLDLPSPAGNNTAIINGKIEIANSEFVEESESSTGTPPSGSPHEHPGRHGERWTHTAGEEWEHRPGASRWHR